MVNPFTGSGYDLVAMTNAIKKLPNLYDRLVRLGLFPFVPIKTTKVTVEQLNGTLNIVKSRPRGAPPDYVVADKRGLRIFGVPHFPVDDVLLPEDYQDVRKFGTENELETQAEIMADKLQKCRNILDQTLEYLRMGALKGIVLDADGSTLYNLYDEFNISQKSVDFELDNAATVVIKKCLEVKRHIEANLKGERMTGVRCLCSATFYDALTTHPEVQIAFANYLNLNQNLAGDYRTGFRFGEIVFEEYPATWNDRTGTPRPGIAANYGICFPEGTVDTFKTIVAPGNFMQAVNTLGEPYYAKTEPLRMDQGVEVHTEGNWLPICLRPEVLVTVSI